MNRALIIKAVSIILMFVGILFVGNIFELFGVYISIVPYMGFIVMLGLVLSFLIFPAKKDMVREKLPWYDILLILCSIAGPGYIAFFSARWTPLIIKGATLLEGILSLLTVIAIIEATRRMVNTSMAIITAFFVVHLLFGAYFPGFLRTQAFSIERIATVFYLRTTGVFGTPVLIATTVFVSLMLFSAFLVKSNAGRFILDFAFSLTGGWKGGPAKASIIGSTIMGTVVGAATAIIVTLGTITIPLMKRTGYSSEFSGAVMAVAANGSQIAPPVMGIVAFIMAEVLGVSYWAIVVAAVLPALLYYIVLFLQVHYRACKLGLTGLPRTELPSLKEILRWGWYFLVPVPILIYFIAILSLPVQHAGLYTAVVTLFIILIDKLKSNKWQLKLQLEQLKGSIVWLFDCFETATQGLLVPLIGCAAAGIIIGSLYASGLGFRLSMILLGIAGENVLLLLILSAVVSYVLGMGMTSVPCYLVLAILVSPALVDMGINPIAAHFFMFYFGIMSFITPPVAIAVFVASGIAGGDPIRTGLSAMKLAITSYIVPFLFIYDSTLLMQGSVSAIVLHYLAYVIGFIAIASALEGYIAKNTTGIERLLLLVGGAFMLFPNFTFWQVKVVGLIILALVWIMHMKSVKIGKISPLQAG